ncbi:MAG: ribonuclease III [Clostridia bacterium]|nr:ribonuclease III [Clostridia bacterium]
MQSACEAFRNSGDPAQLAPLSLAYMGDTVYDLFVRTMLLETTTLTVHGLHQRAAKLVCAKAQAAAFRAIEPLLDEKELSVYRRGRNSHIGTVPKSASIMDYRTATGLEALIGFLYLSGENERLNEIMRLILSQKTD